MIDYFTHPSNFEGAGQLGNYPVGSGFLPSAEFTRLSEFQVNFKAPLQSILEGCKPYWNSWRFRLAFFRVFEHELKRLNRGLKRRQTVRTQVFKMPQLLGVKGNRRAASVSEEIKKWRSNKALRREIASYREILLLLLT